MKEPNFSHDFFDKWTEQMAYILGFWYADGCIMISKNKNNAYKRFYIGNTDKQIMNNISEIIGIKPSTIKPRKHSYKCSYAINVNSNKFFDFCYSLVGTTDKTHSTHFPNIPNKYLNHFVRGYFDGDGSIFIKKYESRHGNPIINLSSSFTASNESWMMLNELKKLLMKTVFTGNKKISMQKFSKGFSLELIHASKLVFCQYDTMLLCEWMYKDATIFMERKKKIWDDFDKNKLRDSVKYFSNKV
jgi:hypothetical protein